MCTYLSICLFSSSVTAFLMALSSSSLFLFLSLSFFLFVSLIPSLLFFSLLALHFLLSFCLASSSFSSLTVSSLLTLFFVDCLFFGAGTVTQECPHSSQTLSTHTPKGMSYKHGCMGKDQSNVSSRMFSASIELVV